MTKERIQQMDSRELDRHIALMLGWQEIPERDWEIIVRVRKQEGAWRGVPNDFKVPRDMINPDGYLCSVPSFSSTLAYIENLLTWAHKTGRFVQIESSDTGISALVSLAGMSFDVRVKGNDVGEMLSLALCQALLLSTEGMGEIKDL